MTPLMLIFMLPPAYLLVGYIVMSLIGMLSGVSIPRGEFMHGILIWPVLFVHAVTLFIAVILTRYLG